REFDLNQTGSMTNSKTEGYAPIEQYERRGKFGAYTDVYALAATLYALLTGDTPLPSNFRKTGIPLPSPKQQNPEISDRVNDGIIKGMGLEPNQRPQRVKEWLELLIPPPAKPVNSPRVAQTPRNNSPAKIQTQKFKFEYAKINEKLYIIKYPGEAEGFTEDLGNGVTLEMIKIPGGSFIMGAPEDEKESRGSERPQHQVNIQPFFMGKYQVTQEQYQGITGENPSQFQGKKRPVEKVNWCDGVEFCEQLSKLTGKEYRLPSEAEWEYACRAGTTTPFHFGETITTDLANYRGDYYTYGAAPKGDYHAETTDVGSFPANPFGLYDMHGNIWEWCFDNWHKNYKGAPIDGSAWLDNNDNLSRKIDIDVLRGGSWDDHPKNCRSAYRNFDYRAVRDDVVNNVGFRVVCGVGRT
ncbi:MAG: formylglycine-generating enzyme family protein, partial [Cyanobacteria bacterium P01_A01_bin.45]